MSTPFSRVLSLYTSKYFFYGNMALIEIFSDGALLRHHKIAVKRINTGQTTPMLQGNDRVYTSQLHANRVER